MQICFATRGACRQTNHRHDRIAAIDDDSNVRHSLVTDVRKYRIEFNTVFNKRGIWITTQAVLAANNIAGVMPQLGLRDQQAIGESKTVMFAHTSADHDDNAVTLRFYTRT